MGDSAGVALDVVDVVRGEGGVDCLDRVWVCSVLDEARDVDCSVLDGVDVVQFVEGENFAARVVTCSVLDGVDVGVVSLDHCCSFLVFNFWNC